MKFKKHISLIIAFFLLMSNMGLAFDVHYCGEEIASVKPVYLELDSQLPEKGCCEKKEIKESTCCKDVLVHFQEKSENTLTNTYSFYSDAVLLNTECKSPVIEQEIYSVANTFSTYHFEANTPLFFKLYRQYLFYD